LFGELDPPKSPRGDGTDYIREDSRLQNAGFKLCKVKLSRPDVVLTIFELLCK